MYFHLEHTSIRCNSGQYCNYWPVLATARVQTCIHAHAQLLERKGMVPRIMSHQEASAKFREWTRDSGPLLHPCLTLFVLNQLGGRITNGRVSYSLLLLLLL